MYLQTCGSFKFAKHKKDWVWKSQILKVPHLCKVCNNKKFIQVRKFADLQFAENICGPPTCVYTPYYHADFYENPFLINDGEPNPFQIKFLLHAINVSIESSKNIHGSQKKEERYRKGKGEKN